MINHVRSSFFSQAGAVCANATQPKGRSSASRNTGIRANDEKTTEAIMPMSLLERYIFRRAMTFALGSLGSLVVIV